MDKETKNILTTGGVIESVSVDPYEGTVVFKKWGSDKKRIVDIDKLDGEERYMYLEMLSTMRKKLEDMEEKRRSYVDLYAKDKDSLFSDYDSVIMKKEALSVKRNAILEIIEYHQDIIEELEDQSDKLFDERMDLLDENEELIEKVEYLKMPPLNKTW